MKTRTASLLKWIGITAVVLAVVYAVLLGLSNRRVSQAYAALEAAGRPMKAEQIIPAAVPGPDNAALVYQAVVLRLNAEWAGDTNLFTHLGSLSPAIITNTFPAPLPESVREVFRRPVVVESLKAIEMGAARPGCRYDIDYSKGAGILLPHLAGLRTLSRILCATARLQAAEGDQAAAWRTLVTSLKLANACREEPMLISHLVRIAQFSMAGDTLQALCAHARPTAGQQAILEELLMAFDDTASIARTMDGERLLLGEWVFRRLPSEGSKLLGFSSSDVWMFSLYTSCTPLLRRDQAAYLEVMCALATNVNQVYSGGDAVLGERMLDAVPRYCVLTRMLVPGLSMSKGRHVSMVAQSRVIRLGLDVLRYREQQGHYPPDLAAIKRDGLVDPFSGKALIYHADPDGFTVYSVGVNLVDDGGMKGRDWKSGDLVWRYTEKKGPVSP
jgi:hypothetical protein